MSTKTLPSLAELTSLIEQYEIIFSSMPIMLWYKDDKNNNLRVNEAAAALEGLHPVDLEQKSSWDLYPKAQADAFYADDLEVIRSGKPKLNIIESHTSPATGEVMWLQTGKVPYRNKNHQITGVIAFAVDITEQKKAELALQDFNHTLELQNQLLHRTHELIRGTLAHLSEAVQHGADRQEIMDYCRLALRDLEVLENRL